MSPAPDSAKIMVDDSITSAAMTSSRHIPVEKRRGSESRRRSSLLRQYPCVVRLRLIHARGFGRPDGLRAVVSNASMAPPGRLGRDVLGRRLIRQPPFRPAFVKSPRCPSGARQPAHRLVGEGAERSAAVRDDLALGWQLRETFV